MTNFWKNFWSSYGPDHVGTEGDLFKQVAQTWEGRPISKDGFHRIVNQIKKQLQLSKEDQLVDFCCGNGIVDYELADSVAYVVGIDFVPRNIQVAKEWKLRKNIEYILGDVRDPLSEHIGENIFPNKYLMNGSLAYFEPTEFELILSNVIQHMAGRSFLFLFTSIPNFDLKWNFYNTPERVKRHLQNEKKRINFNNGVGRWWRPEEIKDICSRHGLEVKVTKQLPAISNFRMDALVTSPG